MAKYKVSFIDDFWNVVGDNVIEAENLEAAENEADGMLRNFLDEFTVEVNEIE